MKPLLGCIADDFTGATDLASTLVKNGMRTVQLMGVPRGASPPETDAIVIAQKTRTAPAADAVDASLSALRWLRHAGCRQYFFKYCSTFDSTDRGNIGPVAEALMDELGCEFTIACPAFPDNGRAVFRGYLFVGDRLLHESGMQDHPLTPMRDSNLVRVLQRQSHGRVGLIPQSSVKNLPQGFADAQAAGVRLAIVDAISNDDLNAIGAACRELPLLTGGSGVAMGLPAMYRAEGWLPAEMEAGRLPRVEGASAVISGSCSLATQRQVAVMKEHAPAFFIDPLRGGDMAADAIRWAAEHLAQGPVLVYATAEAEAVKTVQKELGGVEKAGAMVESALASVARGLRQLGVTRFIVAGGETAGAVSAALGVTGLRIGAEIDPGVPWTVTLGEQPLALALKSGNFGSPDFFLKAWKQLP